MIDKKYTNQFPKKYYKEIVFVFVFFLTYLPTFMWMWDRWFSNDSYYSHGILVPFVSGFLIWQMRDDLKQLKPKSSVWGVWLIVLGVLIHMVSSLFRIYFTSGFSILIVLAGAILHFGGEELFKRAAFPAAFLFFMIPLPHVVVANISFKLRLLAAHIATISLNSLRIPALQEGTIINMRNACVIVDDVCSGLRSLIALAALGSIFTFWMKGKLAKRLLLFLSTVPIAMITSATRVTFLAAVSEIWGTRYATGIVHDVSGFLFFGLAFVLFFIVKNLIE